MHDTTQADGRIRTAAFMYWTITVLGIAAYIALALFGLHNYKLIGRFPPFSEYISNLLNLHEPVSSLYRPIEYMKTLSPVAVIFIGIKLILIGYRYMIETDDNRLLIVYIALSLSSFIESLKDIVAIIDFIPTVSPFVCLGTLIAAIVLSVRLAGTVCGRWFRYNIYAEVFRLLVLPVILSILMIKISDILLGVVLLIVAAGLNGLSGGGGYFNGC